MKHDIASYTDMITFLNTVDEQMLDNLVVLMETEFDDNLTEGDHKLRAKEVKAFNRSVKEVSPVSQTIYPMQVRMMQMRVNVSFLLECAHNKVSYKALAKYLAEYDYVSQKIKKETKKVKNPVLVNFLERSTCLNTDFFNLLLNTANQMNANIVNRMDNYPEQYIDLDIEEDSELDFDFLKNTYKSELKALKEKEKDK